MFRLGNQPLQQFPFDDGPGSGNGSVNLFVRQVNATIMAVHRSRFECSCHYLPKVRSSRTDHSSLGPSR